MHTAVDDLVSALRTAWQDPRSLDGDRLLSGLTTRYLPIAGSDQDQTVQEGTANPLWETVRWLPATTYLSDDALLQPESYPMVFNRRTAQRLSDLGAGRHALATRYAWSIISPGDVVWMAEQLDGLGVVEIGAGSGYWAWQLEQAGVNVAAYDPHPVGEDNRFCTAGPYTTVLQDDASAVRHHGDRALLMVWPPYGGPHARQALAQYEGDLLLYAGESCGGCTADDGFYALLDQEWEETAVAHRHVTWWGIHCQLAAYRRRSPRPAASQTTRGASTPPAGPDNAETGPKAGERSCSVPTTPPAPPGSPASRAVARPTPTGA